MTEPTLTVRLLAAHEHAGIAHKAGTVLENLPESAGLWLVSVGRAVIEPAADDPAAPQRKPRKGAL